MQSVVMSIAIPWVVGVMMSATADINWQGEKTGLASAITGAIHSAWMDKELITIGDAIIDAVAKLSQDKPDIVDALKGLAAGNQAAAFTALRTALAGVLPADLATLVAA